MTRRLIAVACASGLSAMLSGCWVIEELDRGSELMDQHSPNANAKKKAEAAAAVAQPTVAAQQDAVARYFRDEEAAGTTKTFTPGSVSEGIVACKLGGSTQFMKKEDCGVRGGSY
jgi:hypothetical protein